MIRVCPHSDAQCVHGMNCAYTCATDAYDGNKNLMAEQNATRTLAPKGEASWIEPALVDHLRSLGCVCPKPLVGYRPNAGPRCRLCNVEPASPAPEGEGKRLMLVDLDGAPFGSEFLDNLNGYATGGSGRCLDILTMWGATLYASPVVPVGREEDDDLAEAINAMENWLYGIWPDLSADHVRIVLAALGTKATDTGREG